MYGSNRHCLLETRLALIEQAGEGVGRYDDDADLGRAGGPSDMEFEQVAIEARDIAELDLDEHA